MKVLQFTENAEFAGRSWKVGEVALWSHSWIEAKGPFKVLAEDCDWHKADDLTGLPEFYIDATCTNNPKTKEAKRLQAPDGRVWIVPGWETYSGDMVSVVLQIEDRTQPSIRLKSGCNPMWFIRYFEQYARDRREKFIQVSFEENALKRWPGRVEVAVESKSEPKQAPKSKGPTFDFGKVWADLTFIVDTDAEELTIKSGNLTQRAGLKALGFSETMTRDLCLFAEGCGSFDIVTARALELKPGENPLEAQRVKSNHGANVRVRHSRLNEKIEAMFPHLKGKAIVRGKTQFRIETQQNNELDSLINASELDRRGLLRL